MQSSLTLAAIQHRLAKLIRFWRSVWDGSWLGTWLVLGGSYMLMMLLAVIGARSSGDGRFRAVHWATICLCAVVHLVFWGMICDRNYIEPFFFPFVARGVLLVWDRLSPRVSWSLRSTMSRFGKPEFVRTVTRSRRGFGLASPWTKPSSLEPPWCWRSMVFAAACQSELLLLVIWKSESRVPVR